MLKLVGMDGTGRYPDSSGHVMCQFGWNRGSYKLSSLVFLGTGVFLCFPSIPLIQ